MLLDILEEHFDEASFLAGRWINSDGEDPGRPDLEARLRAHLEGLLSGGAISWELSKERLTDPGSVFVGAWLAARGPRSWNEFIEQSSATATMETSAAIQRARHLA